ncbi:MAG: hypothetical protein ABI346_05950, partial [Candidatus Baltobacteraceae bacterium]
MSRLLRFGAFAILLVAILGIGAWLNLPGSLLLTARALGEQRHPVDFDFAFSGLGPHPLRVPVQLFYFPKTPILGISEHYWSIIAPLRVDTVTRSFEVDVREGHVRWSAPLGLAGLSNFRLQSLSVGEPGAAYALRASAVRDAARAPRSLELPAIVVNGGQYRYDGALALWRRPGNEQTDPYVYSPRVDDVTRQLIWDGLRALHARIDLAAYPVATFIVPSGWHGEGWKNEGFQ